MKSKLADNVIHAYIETILPQIGPSRFILMVNGTEFKNDTMNSVLIRLNMEHKFTTVYFPRGNSRLENLHALLKRSISKYIDLLDVEWDRCLNLVALKFNNKLIIFFLCLRILHGQQPYNDHDVISYLHHTVVMTAEPATSPTAPSSLPRDAVPNFAVNNS